MLFHYAHQFFHAAKNGLALFGRILGAPRMGHFDAQLVHGRTIRLRFFGQPGTDAILARLGDGQGQGAHCVTQQKPVYRVMHTRLYRRRIHVFHAKIHRRFKPQRLLPEIRGATRRPLIQMGHNLLQHFR